MTPRAGGAQPHTGPARHAEFQELDIQLRGVLLQLVRQWDGLVTEQERMLAGELYDPLLDIGLPRMNGYELARRLRALPELRNTRFVALSGYAPPQVSQEATNIFDRYLVKQVGLRAGVRGAGQVARKGIADFRQRSSDHHIMPTTDAQVSIATLQVFADAWNRHDVDALMSFMTDDCVFEASAGPEVCGTRYVGFASVRAGFAEVWATYPDAHWGNASHFVVSDRGVSEWTFTGTSHDGTRVEVHGCDLFTFRHGKIALKNSYRKNRAAHASLAR